MSRRSLRRFTPYERVMRRCKRQPNGCLLWTGAGKGNGYGNVRVGKKNETPHRIVFEHHHGEQPSKVDVCHTCDNRACCEITHLFAGSRLENMLDCARKGRLSRGAKHGAAIAGDHAPGAKLNWRAVRAIRLARRKGYTSKRCAELFHVSIENVRLIWNNRTWKEEYAPRIDWDAPDEADAA